MKTPSVYTCKEYNYSTELMKIKTGGGGGLHEQICPHCNSMFVSEKELKTCVEFMRSTLVQNCFI